MVDFDPGFYIDNHTSTGGYDAYLSKFNSSGTYQWGLTWGGLQGDDVGKGVATDDAGAVCVTGYFEGLANFETGPGQEFHESNGAVDAFLSKFDQAGTRYWTRTWGGGSYERALSVAIDNSGDVYTTGLFHSPTDFDTGPGIDLHIPFDGDAFLSKLDANGAFLWAETWGGEKRDYAFDVATDEVGNTYVTGYFEEICDFNTGLGTDIHIPQGASDVFLTKFDPTGSFTWARTWGGTADDFGNSVSIDFGGSIFLAGFKNYVVDFDPGPGFDIQGFYDESGGRGFLMMILPDGYW